MESDSILERCCLLFDFGKDCNCKKGLVNMLTVAALLIVEKWKSQEVLVLGERLVKIRYLCLLKLTEVCKFRTGDYDALQKFK